MTTTTKPTAEVLEYDSVGMPATKRCDRCGAQAYVQAEVIIKDLAEQSQELLFCAHHYDKHGDALRTHPLVKRIFDYTPRLRSEEQAKD